MPPQPRKRRRRPTVLKGPRPVLADLPDWAQWVLLATLVTFSFWMAAWIVVTVVKDRRIRARENHEADVMEAVVLHRLSQALGSRDMDWDTCVFPPRPKDYVEDGG